MQVTSSSYLNIISYAPPRCQKALSRLCDVARRSGPTLSLFFAGIGHTPCSRPPYALEDLEQAQPVCNQTQQEARLPCTLRSHQNYVIGSQPFGKIEDFDHNGAGRGDARLRAGDRRPPGEEEGKRALVIRAGESGERLVALSYIRLRGTSAVHDVYTLRARYFNAVPPIAP